MSTPVEIRDGGTGSGARVCVTPIGQLVAGPYAYDETKYTELAAADTAYNFYEPKAGQQFVITGIIMNADQQVAIATGATIVIYEATSAGTATVSKVLHQDEMIRNDRTVLLPLNILVSEGRYVNAKTDDDDVHMTITGYYIPAIE